MFSDRYLSNFYSNGGSAITKDFQLKTRAWLKERAIKKLHSCLMLLRLPGDSLEFGERLTRKSQKQFHKILGTIYRAHNHSWHRYFERAIVSRNTILNTVEPRYKEDPARYTEKHLKAWQNYSEIRGNEPRYNE